MTLPFLRSPGQSGAAPGAPIPSPEVSPDLVAFVRPGPVPGPTVDPAAELQGTILVLAAHVRAFRRRFPDLPDAHGWRNYAATDLAGLPYAGRHAAALLGPAPADVPRLRLARDPDDAMADLLARLDRGRDAVREFRRQHRGHPAAAALRFLDWCLVIATAALWGELMSDELTAAYERFDAATACPAERRAA